MSDSERLQLRGRLRELARDLPAEAGPAVEIRLRANFRGFHKRRKQRRLAFAGLAATLAILLGGAGYYAGRNGAQEQALRSANALTQARREWAGFVALPYAESGVPIGEPWIVHVNVPLAELDPAAAALAPPGRVVSADLLVGQDGIARAVRFTP